MEDDPDDMKRSEAIQQTNNNTPVTTNTPRKRTSKPAPQDPERDPGISGLAEHTTALCRTTLPLLHYAATIYACRPARDCRPTFPR